MQRKSCPITRACWYSYQASEFCFSLARLASEAFYGIKITEELLSILLIVGLVKMTCGLVRASYRKTDFLCTLQALWSMHDVSTWNLSWHSGTHFLCDIFGKCAEFSAKKRCQIVSQSLRQITFQILFNHEVHKQDLMINSSHHFGDYFSEFGCQCGKLLVPLLVGTILHVCPVLQLSCTLIFLPSHYCQWFDNNARYM